MLSVYCLVVKTDEKLYTDCDDREIDRLEKKIILQTFTSEADDTSHLMFIRYSGFLQ